MVELHDDALVFRFPEVHPLATCTLSFQRTLRIPDDNRTYPLPPGFGRFPMEHVEDHATRLPASWAAHGGVLLPMYQAEALWIDFGRAGAGYPCAVKIAAGKIDAVSGKRWREALTRKPQDYVVVPDQPWLDGFCVGKRAIRQFVAMPLGRGYTAEEQIAGTAEHGGLQIVVRPMKRSRYEALQRRTAQDFGVGAPCRAVDILCADMGLAPGGLMRQSIHQDPHGPDAWETEVSARCFVHLLNSRQWEHCTGTPAPGKPPGAREYADAGLPWFDYYDDTHAALPGTAELAGLDSVAAKGVKLGEQPLDANDPVQPARVVALGPGAGRVSDGNW